MIVKIAWDQQLGRLLAKPLARMGMHPNAVTTIGLLLGLASGVLYALGEAEAANWGAGIFVLAAFMDHVDGEVARMTGKTSTFGHYYDHVAAMTSYTAMFVGAGIGFRDSMLGEWAVLLGILAGVSVAATMSVRLRIEVRQGKGAVRQNNLFGFEPEDTLYLVGPVTWLGGMLPFVVAAGIGGPIFLLFVLRQLRRGPAMVGSGPES